MRRKESLESRIKRIQEACELLYQEEGEFPAYNRVRDIVRLEKNFVFSEAKKWREAKEEEARQKADRSNQMFYRQLALQFVDTFKKIDADRRSLEERLDLEKDKNKANTVLMSNMLSQAMYEMSEFERAMECNKVLRQDNIRLQREIAQMAEQMKIINDESASLKRVNLNWGSKLFGRFRPELLFNAIMLVNMLVWII